MSFVNDIIGKFQGKIQDLGNNKSNFNTSSSALFYNIDLLFLVRMDLKQAFTQWGRNKIKIFEKVFTYLVC